MNIERTQLSLTSTVSNWSLTRSALEADDTLPRDGGLLIEGTGPYNFLGLGDLFDPAAGAYRGTSQLTEARLSAAVRSCVGAWKSAVVDYAFIEDDASGGESRFLPYQLSFDARSIDSASFNHIMGRLAVAGSRLFKEIFSSGDTSIGSIGRCLEQAGKKDSLVLSITSDSFFVPWRLLYVHPTGELAPNGANWQKEGFWGYRHIIEHNTRKTAMAKAITSPVSRLKALFNLDERIGLIDDNVDIPDPSLAVDSIETSPCVLEHMRALSKFPLSVRKNTTKSGLAACINLQPHPDHLVYFLCRGFSGDLENGTEKPSYMVLSDGNAVTSSELAAWLNDEPFEANPLVFFNTCLGGQIGINFYRQFVNEFLATKAGCVIGPQLDLPPAFALEFAGKFFESMLDGTKKPKLGPLLQELSRAFLDDFNNPLAMTYALYQGADLRVVL